MFISSAFAQAASSSDGAIAWLGQLLAFLAFVALPIAVFFVGASLQLKRRNQETRQRKLAEQREIIQGRQIIIKTYRGSQAEATMRFQADSTLMAAGGYFPTSQTWAVGQWSARAYFGAVLLIVLFGLGILILGYMLIVKPDGTLTVTYERRAVVEEKTCPRCAEHIKAAALVCRFCGYEFAPEQSEQSDSGNFKSGDAKQ